MMYNSKLELLQHMFQDGAQDINKVTRRPVTAGKNFKTSMAKLVEQLALKEPFYVRCIKPNEKKSSTIYNEQRVAHQVHLQRCSPSSHINSIDSIPRLAGECPSAPRRLCQPTDIRALPSAVQGHLSPDLAKLPVRSALTGHN